MSGKKGHWPAGKRRHPPPPRRVLRALETIRAALDSRPKRWTIRECQEEVGANYRTVRRWISGEYWPAPERWDGILHAAKIARGK